jgi:hypothetical protein
MLEKSLDRWRKTRGYESTGLRALLHRLWNPIKASTVRLSKRPEVYVATAPSIQGTLDLFKGEWASAFPPSLGTHVAGRLPLFADNRLKWGVEGLGGVRDRNVLELGPLDGGHTFALEQMGAAGITAVEANQRAYLRCLVLKEVLDLTRSRFLLGDCRAFLRDNPERRFDVCVASGILYHLDDPIDLLFLLSQACPKVYIWTHYFDSRRIVRRPSVHARFRSAAANRIRHGFEHVAHPYHYEFERFYSQFAGGSKHVAHWLEREQLIDALRHFGYAEIQVAFEEPDHIHGPAIAITAQKG